jgi:hypothetical protein
MGWTADDDGDDPALDDFLEKARVDKDRVYCTA